MLNWKQEWSRRRDLWSRGRELLLLRLRLLHLDLTAQAAQLLRVLAAVAVAAVLLLTALTAALLALYAWLPESWRAPVLAGVAVLCAGVAAVLLWRVPQQAAASGQQVAQTLRDFGGDAALLLDRPAAQADDHEPTNA